MRLAVVGSRDFPESREYVVREAIQAVGTRVDWDLELVSGGARGVDTMAWRAALAFGIPIIVHQADWKGQGRSAGHRRNALIVADADEMLAFFGPTRTPGTTSSVNLARKKGIPVRVFDVKETA